MKTLEIKRTNIESLGYKVGKGVRGKGTEIFEPLKSFYTFWDFKEDSINEFKIKLELYNTDINDLYIRGCRFKGKEQCFENHFPISEAKFNLKEIIESNFKDFQYCSIYLKPKFLGYFSLSKYNINQESQKQMILDFINKFEDEEIYGELVDSEYDYMEFCSCSDGSLWNGDYHQHHGDSYYVEDTGECEYVDGRVYEYNETVLEDFWLFGPDESGYLNEIDPNNTISVYSRKGKDWYIGYTLESKELYITYKDDDDEIIEEELFYGLFYKPNKDLLKNVVSIVKSWKEDIEVRSYIYNQFERENKDRIVNLDLIEMIDEDIIEFRNTILDNIEKWDKDTISEEFLKAYYSLITERVKVLEDKTVVIKGIKYNHFRKILKFGKILNFEIVYSSLVGSSIYEYAIKKDDEEYHFNIAELIANDISDEISLRDALEQMLEAIENRKLQKIQNKELFEKASYVFVSIEDSLASGNCAFGTNEFILRKGIDTSKIGGIRGDELLKMELSNFTKRAVAYAITNHNIQVAS